MDGRRARPAHGRHRHREPRGRDLRPRRAAAGKEYHFRGGPGLLRGAARVPGSTSSRSRTTTASTTAATRSSTRSPPRAPPGWRRSAAARRSTRRGGPAILEAGGLRIAVLGYSDVRPYGFDAGPDWAGTAPADPPRSPTDVAAARRRADLVVVWFHWGQRARAEPERPAAGARGRDARRPGVGRARRAPARAPAGQRQGRKLVAWSLGNFVFPSGRPQTTSTGVLLATLDAHGVTGFRLAPATIHGFRPELGPAPRQSSGAPSRRRTRRRGRAPPSLHVT